jgi:hypothetical protein
MVELYLGKTGRSEVIDIYSVPDYTALFEPCIDPNFGLAFKNTKSYQYTQLQWKFESCGRDSKHPVGVKTTYRAYCMDAVFEIIPVDVDRATHIYSTGLRVQRTVIPDEPEDPNEIINILYRFPTDPIRPAGFKLGTSEGFKVTLRGIKQYFGEKSSTFSEWLGFANQFLPIHDSVVEYLRDIDWNSEIPMKDKLFGTDYPIDKESDVNPTVSMNRGGKKDSLSSKINDHYFDGAKIVIGKANASVRHSGNLKPLHPRTVIEDEAVARTPEEAAELQLKAIKNMPIEVHKGVIISYLKAAKIPHAASSNKEKLLQRFIIIVFINIIIMIFVIILFILLLLLLLISLISLLLLSLL